MSSDKVESPDQRQSRLLIATPDLNEMRGIATSFASDIEIDLVETGWEAGQKLEQSEYDLLVLDTGLQVVGAMDLVERIHKEKLSEASILMNYVDGEAKAMRRLQIENKCQGSLEKPFQPGDFLSAVWDLLDKRLEQEEFSSPELSPLQTRLLKVTSANIRRIFTDVGEGQPLDTGSVDETSKLIVEGARSDELDYVLSRLHTHHSYSFVHSLKVSSLMTIFGVYVGMNQTDLELMAQGGLLHDIGKSKTPAHLLNKPTKLDEKEWAEMQNHVPLSGEILRATPGIDPSIVNIAERHHEKLDGSGYPNGLKGAQMDDPSLVAAIMDIYSALTDKRAYKQPFTMEKSLSIMQEMRGHHIEETFFNKFEEMLRSGAADKQLRNSTG